MISVAIYSDLGNRLSPLGSALALAKEKKAKLRIYWEIMKNTRIATQFCCEFRRLYEKPKMNVEILDQSSFLYLKQGKFSKIIDRKMHKTMAEALSDICEDKGVCIRLPYPFHAKWRKEVRNLEPISEIRQRIEETAANFNDNTIGVHIRRTDNPLSIAKSPTWAFYKAMDEEIAKNKNASFFFATDSKDEETAAIEQYGRRIIVYPKRERRRNCTEGIQDALVDLYCLSKTRRMIGSDYSTFSGMAATLGEIPVKWICVEGK